MDIFSRIYYIYLLNDKKQTLTCSYKLKFVVFTFVNSTKSKSIVRIVVFTPIDIEN